jgi:hypothetical protein
VIYEIMHLKALFDPKARAHINDTLFFTPDEQDSDVAIILGGGSITGETARAASRIIDQNISAFPLGVIITGGVAINEPWKHRGLKLLGATVDRHDCLNGLKETTHASLSLGELAYAKVVLRELSATNTGENFANIASEMSHIGARTATVFCPAPTQRRVIDTARVHMPNVTVTTKPVYPWFPKDFWLDHWHKNPVSAHYVLSEFKKIDPNNPRNYYERGFCVRAPQ